jgi:hypothetical protein
MKPLLSQPVQRGVKLCEWEPAEHHGTVDGLNAFAERQRQRREQAEANRKATAGKVRAISKGRA